LTSLAEAPSILAALGKKILLAWDHYGTYFMVAGKVRFVAIVVAMVVVVIAAALGGVYAALRREQPFYRQALSLEPQTLEQNSRQLESQAAALYNEARRPGQWQAAFTADQINGWLATKLDEFGHKDRLEAIIAPRVAIEDGTFMLGFRARRGGVETIVSANAAVSVTETGAVAIRLIDVRAGSLPLPVMQVADELSKACQDLQLPVRWTQDSGRPVALIEIEDSLSNRGRTLVLDAAELRNATLFLAGHTEERVGASNGNDSKD
jgi:hypothetical protein